MKPLYEQPSEYTDGYRRIDPDLLQTPLIVYEKHETKSQTTERGDRIGAYSTQSTTGIGEQLDLLL